MTPVPQEPSKPILNDIAAIFATVLVIMVVLFAIGWIMLGLLDEALEDQSEGEPFPHGISRDLHATSTRTTAIPSPVSFEVLGNATGTQHLLVLDKTGNLAVYVSNDLFSENLSIAWLTRFDFNNLTSVDLELGYAANGSIGVHAERGSFDWYWVQDEQNGTFLEVGGSLALTGHQRPDLELEDLPASSRILDYGAGWDVIHLDDRDVVVAEFMDWGGCLEWSYCPGVSYRMPNGHWSDIVVLDQSHCDGISIAGTSMDDMFVVTWEEERYSVRWWFYPVTDDTVVETGIRH